MHDDDTTTPESGDAIACGAWQRWDHAPDCPCYGVGAQSECTCAGICARCHRTAPLPWSTHDRCPLCVSRSPPAHANPCAVCCGRCGGDGQTAMVTVDNVGGRVIRTVARRHCSDCGGTGRTDKLGPASINPFCLCYDPDCGCQVREAP